MIYILVCYKMNTIKQMLQGIHPESPMTRMKRFWRVRILRRNS